MKLVLGIGAAGLLAAGAWQIGPEHAVTIAVEALTPAPEIVQEVRLAIDALIEQFKGPGDVSPDA